MRPLAIWQWNRFLTEVHHALEGTFYVDIYDCTNYHERKRGQATRINKVLICDSTSVTQQTCSENSIVSRNPPNDQYMIALI